MSIISLETVRLQAHASDKQDAIRQAGELLVQSGSVKPPYVTGMLQREQTMSTYIGNGVAIPHGQYNNRADVQRVAISVLQVPEGVEWELGESAYLVIGIAANSEEHLGVMANLAEVIRDVETVTQLAQTNDPMLIIERLSRTPSEDEEDD
jgi:phosphocarrier protein FPr